MKPIIILAAITALSTLVTFAAPPANQLLEDNARAEHNFNELNAKLTAVTKKLSSKFQEPEAKAFAKAQASWTTWRDTEAEYIAHRYAPTKASSPEIQTLAFDAIKTGNKIQITESRLKQLQAELSDR